jgi:putative transposase
LHEKRSLILPGDPDFSIVAQCDLLQMSRSSYYYTPCPESDFNLKAMKAIDRLYTECPHYGKRTMSANLKNQGINVGVDLARSLMRKMRIEAIYQKPRLSQRNPEHKVYPYLLRGTKIVRINQVWATDITYIPMRNGFLYLTAVIDWHSRYVLAWKLSNSLDGLFCREVLLEALMIANPEIFNTDQGAQYTCLEFIKILTERNIQVSMDGRGRALDNAKTERLWRTVKYENIYPRDYCDGGDLHAGLTAYFTYYNTKRLHSAHNYKTPLQVYYEAG